MSDLAPSEFHEDVYAHPLISWGAVIRGGGGGHRAGSLAQHVGPGHRRDRRQSVDHGQRRRQGPDRRRRLWVAFSNAVALQVGAYIAARAAKYPDHNKGMFQGLAVWGVAFVLAFAALGSGVGGVLRGGDAAATAYAEAADDASVPSDGRVSEADAKAAAEATADATASLAWWGVAHDGPGRDRRRCRRPPGRPSPRLASTRPRRVHQRLGGRHERRIPLAAGHPVADHPAAVPVPRSLT
jgi:hypothetical protein